MGQLTVYIPKRALLSLIQLLTKFWRARQACVVYKAGAEQFDWQLIVATVKHNIFLDENRIILPFYNEYDMSQILKFISSLQLLTFL